MLTIEPGNAILGAHVTGVDLNRPLSEDDFARVLQALGRYGVLCFPEQPIEAAALRTFSSRFGDLQVISGNQDRVEPGMPEVSILSNVIENGRPIGIPDAGQDWHTDMTYNRVVGFVNVLVAYAVPMRDGQVLGATEFTSTGAAYDGLPEEVKQRLAGATATHDFCKYWDMMRREKGSSRPPLTDEQRRMKPPVHHPVFLDHPISGRKVIYVNPGFTEVIDGMPRDESDRMLEFLFAHVLKPEYRYVYRWSVRDVLLWDHIGTWHNAVADYGPNEHRHMKRCQVLADRIFDPQFVRTALAA